MNKKICNQTTAFTAVIIALTAGSAMAGTPERSGQSVTSIFERGTYGELSFAGVSPNLTGKTSGGSDISDLGDTYLSFGGAYKRDVNDRLSIGLIIDQPWGADITYDTAASSGVFSGSNTEWNSTAVTALARYKLDGGFSIHGGLRAETLSIDVNLPVASALNSIKSSTGFGYTVGVAYEIPEKATRVSLTYHSAVTHEADVEFNGASDGQTKFDMPKSFNLEFRKAISRTTIVFGSARYIDWKSLDIDTNSFGDLVSYSDNTLQTQIGVGKAFSKEWSGALMVDYEPATDSPVSDLSPTDGKFGIGAAATYTMGTTKITGLLKVLRNGDAVSRSGSTFDGNTTLALGVKLAKTF